MSSIRELHTRAMEMAQLALLARSQGRMDNGADGMRKAFELERQAADLLADPSAPEPTRSIIHRSAASMAMQCGEHDAAERLIARALAGMPPRLIAEQLRDLFAQVNLQRHLDVRGIDLGTDQVQVSFAGPAIGSGFAPISAIIERLTTIQRMAERTGERLIGRPFREGGPPPREVRQVFVTTPRAASFAVSIQVGEPRQMTLPGHPPPGEPVLTEMLDGLALVVSGDIDALRDRIRDDAYFRNFVALSERIAPDGTQVSLVGFTAFQHGQERRIMLQQTRSELESTLASTIVDSRPSLPPDTAESLSIPEPRVFVGELRLADEIREASHKIKIILDPKPGGRRRKHITLNVQPGMMADIVKPLWGERVTVRAIKHDDKLFLETIDRAE